MQSSAAGKLVRQLQLAYSGELGAGFAYRGHWKSLRDPEEIARVRQIEEEEWHHRAIVGSMLASLGARPARAREIVFFLIGKTIGILCHLGGWFIPMYGAGKLESRNVREYEDAADYAIECGRPDLIDGLLEMAEVEWEHERYFRERVEGHRMLRWFPLWPPIPPKETIRLGTRVKG